MNVLKIARVPAITVSPEATVLDAIRKMVDAGVGAVVVVEDDRPKGIFTERDVLRRVVVRQLPPEATPVAEVMASPVQVVREDTSHCDALKIMDSKHFRHLPIVDEESRIKGMLSIRHALHQMIEELSQELHALDSYLCADGIGG